MRLFLALFCACTPPRPSGTPVIEIGGSNGGTAVVHVGKSAITLEQLRARLEALGPGKERMREAKELRAFVDNQIRFELLVAEALRRGLDKDPEVQEAARRTTVQKLVAQELDLATASADEINRAYEQNINDYRQPERVQVALIAFASEAAASGALAKLEANEQDEAAFLAVARESGESVTEPRYWSEAELSEQFGEALAKAVFAVKELGALGPVTPSNGKHYVFKVTGRRPAVSRSLADAASGLRQRIGRQKRNEAFEALITRLRSDVPVTVDEQKLMDVWQLPQPASLHVEGAQ